jgi:hypothetical protein
VAAGVWAAAGPLQPGWAARAGTPASLLGHQSAPATASAPGATGTPSNTTSSTGASTGTAATSGALPVPPYQAQFTGTLGQKPAGSGLIEVDLTGRTTTSPTIVFTVALVGTPDRAGGVLMQQGRGTVGTPGAPTTLSGQVVGLQGTRIVLAMHDAGGTAQTLQLRIDINGGSIAGTLAVSSGAPGGSEGGGE